MKIYVKNMVTKPENPSLSWVFLGCTPQENLFSVFHNLKMALSPLTSLLKLSFLPLFLLSSPEKLHSYLFSLACPPPPKISSASLPKSTPPHLQLPGYR